MDSTNGEAPDFGRGLLLFWASAGTSNQSSSTPQPSPTTISSPSKIRAVNSAALPDAFKSGFQRAEKAPIL